MRVAYLSADRGVPVLGPGGSSVHVRELIRAFVSRGAEVTLFTSCAPVEQALDSLPCRVVDVAADPALNELRVRTAKRIRQGGMESTRASELYSLLLNQTMLEELEKRRGDFDLIYERHSLWSFSGMQFAERSGLPFFIEVNAPLSDQQQDYRELDLVETSEVVSSMVLPAADRVLLTTSGLSSYVQSCGVSRRNIRVVPCGVSDAMFADCNRPPRGKGEPFVIGFLGSLKPWHGIDVLLKAFARLHDISDEYRLLVVGDGPMRSDIESFCRNCHLEDFVTLTGKVDHAEVPEYLARMDAGVAPYPALSSFYFSPLKIWEYAAAGVPIVASESGEIPELFPHKKLALLHPPGKFLKIVKHVEQLRNDPEYGPRLTRRARGVAREHTWDRLAARIEGILESLRSSSPP